MVNLISLAINLTAFEISERYPSIASQPYKWVYTGVQGGVTIGLVFLFNTLCAMPLFERISRCCEWVIRKFIVRGGNERTGIDGSTGNDDTTPIQETSSLVALDVDTNEAEAVDDN